MYYFLRILSDCPDWEKYFSSDRDSQARQGSIELLQYKCAILPLEESKATMLNSNPFAGYIKNDF